MMKKMTSLLCAFLVLGLFVSPIRVSAGEDVQILTKSEIEKLNNDELKKTYIDAKIQVEAYKAFGRAGYSHKDYSDYKDLLTFIVNMRQEMEKRQIDAPPVDDWLE